MNQLTYHDDFIEKPVQSVLEEGLQTIRNIEHGIEVYPLYEYLLQSIFLKMTGFQEQKLKLIHWTIATYNHDVRRKYQKDYANKYYSKYDEKNALFKILYEKTFNQSGVLEIFGKNNDDSNLRSNYRSELYSKFEDKREEILKNIMDSLGNDEEVELLGIIESLSQKVQNMTVVSFEVSFNEIDDFCKKVKERIDQDVALQSKEEKNGEKSKIFKIKELKSLSNQLADDFGDEKKFGNFIVRKFLEKVTNDYYVLVSHSKHPEMFGKYLHMQDLKGELIKDEGFYGSNNIFNPNLNLIKCHKLLYDHRNRCAHNTLSYQNNLPTLDVLADENHQKFDNYYIRFLILILIDEIFMVLFKKYKEIILSEMNV